MIRFTIPLKTISVANSREHWAFKAKRVKRERHVTLFAALEAGSKRWADNLLPCVVTLTRRGGQMLDTDNLHSALKACRDSIAEVLGVDDADPRVTWVVQQRSARRIGRQVEYAVEVEIESAPATALPASPTRPKPRRGSGKGAAQGKLPLVEGD